MSALSALLLSASLLAAEPWVRVETPHFTLITDADARVGRNVALELEQARALFLEAIGDEVSSGLPVIIFAMRDRAGLARLLPGLSGEPPLGVFSSSPDRHRIAVRLDEPSSHRFQSVYHEYHHLLLRSSRGPAPSWLVEGLAEFWSHMERPRGDGFVEVGRPSPRHMRALSLFGSMPLARLLRYEGNVHAEPAERIAVFYAQSWAVVHHLMLRGGATADPAALAASSRKFDRYIGLANETGDPVGAFESVFGPVAAAESALHEYLNQTMFPVARVEEPLPPPASEFRIGDVAPAEASAAVGMFVATGPWPERARPALEEALELEPGSTTAMEGMGFLAFRMGELSEAERWFSQVADADGTSYLAHYYLALLAGRRPGSGELVETSLKRAVASNPRFVPAVLALSSHLAGKAGREAEALELARDATRLAPELGEAWRNLAEVLDRIGREEEAAEAAKRAR